MKNRIFSLLTAILCVLIIASFAAADAGLYPIGQQQTQSYPVPQYMQPQQQNETSILNGLGGFVLSAIAGLLLGQLGGGIGFPRFPKL